MGPCLPVNTVPAAPDVPEEPSTRPRLRVFRMWYWLWPSLSPSPQVLPLSINPWFQFDFVYKVGFLFFFFLAFCFLNKPKSKTNAACSTALPLPPCPGLILHPPPHPEPSLCRWRCLLLRVLGGRQLWGPWPAGQERGCYRWLGQPCPDHPLTQQGAA